MQDEAKGSLTGGACDVASEGACGGVYGLVFYSETWYSIVYYSIITWSNR